MALDSKIGDDLDSDGSRTLADCRTVHGDAQGMSETPTKTAGQDSKLLSCENEDYEARKKRTCLAALLGMMILVCILTPFVPEEANLLDVVLGIPILVAALVWVDADAAQLGTRISWRLRLLIILLMPLGFAVYCLSRRRYRALAGGVALFLACMVVMLAIAFLVSLRRVVHGDYRP